VESFGSLGCGVHFRLRHPGDIDLKMANFMREAFTTSQKNSLRQPRSNS
jgi:hypothetical protein